MNIVRQSFRDLTFREVLACSREHLSSIALIEVEPFGSDRLHDIGLEVRLLEGASVGRLWSSPGRATRTREHVAQSGDNVVLVMPTSTPMVISRAGHDEVPCRPGEAFVWASDEPASFAYGRACDTLNISIPRNVAETIAPRFARRVMTTIDHRDAPDLRLLCRYTALLLGEEGMSPAAAALAAAHLQELVGLVLSPGESASDARGLRGARLAAIKADLLENLALPLSPAAVAARHGISARYLRDLFAGEGGSFTAFVLGARLERARRMLCHPRRRGATIAATAYASGFNDLSYFNRAFRRRFGLSPSELVASMQAGGRALPPGP